MEIVLEKGWGCGRPSRLVCGDPCDLMFYDGQYSRLGLVTRVEILKLRGGGDNIKEIRGGPDYVGKLKAGSVSTSAWTC